MNMVTVGAMAGLAFLAWKMSESDANAENQTPQLPQEPRSDSGPEESQGPVPIFSPRRLTAAQQAMARLIVDQASQAGIDPAFMLALAVTESSLNQESIGDDGLSVGLFQMNKKFQPNYSVEDLLDPSINVGVALTEMATLFRRYPGHTFGDYAEAWSLGGAGRFVKNRRNRTKLKAMERAIKDLSLTLDLNARPL